MLKIKKLNFVALFLLGLGIRIVLVFMLLPNAVSQWYLPFLKLSLLQPTFDPWSYWMSTGGTPDAFPYGYAMWFVFLPFMFVVKLLTLPLQYGYALTILVVDVVLCFIINKLLPNKMHFLLLSYWLSPIIIFAGYGLGLNDLVPTLFLILSIYFIRKVNFIWAGIFYAAAISAKLSMIIALPFFLIYLYNNKALRQKFPTFLISFFCTACILELPFIFSDAGLQMLFGNPEMKKIYLLSLNLSTNVHIFVIPLLYILILYISLKIKRLNFDLFQTMIGITFLLIVLMTPASPGWFIWAIPFFVHYQAKSDRLAFLLVGVFSILYSVSILFINNFQFVNGYEFSLIRSINLNDQMQNYVVSILHTFILATGIILAIRYCQDAIKRNDFFRLKGRPFTIGVAGDSGAGKDTFGEAIAGLFGHHSVVKLSGDNYHLWDRNKPMWQIMTHLNPLANDIECFYNDLVSLIKGKSIHSRHYSHQTGKMGKPLAIKSNAFIVASGLHVLFLPVLRDCYDLKIYLEIDESLRRYFKVKRDVYQRGHTFEQVKTSLAKREPDAVRFIRPQASFADLIFSLQPVSPITVEKIEEKHDLRLKLIVNTRMGYNEVSLVRILVGVCGLQVDITVKSNTDVTISIEGEISAADVALAAQMLCPQALELLDLPPKWQDGMTGLMQLVTLSHISQNLVTR